MRSSDGYALSAAAWLVAWASCECWPRSVFTLCSNPFALSQLASEAAHLLAIDCQFSIAPGCVGRSTRVRAQADVLRYRTIICTRTYAHASPCYMNKCVYLCACDEIGVCKCSYKRVKGRSHTVEKRISMLPHKPHATSQPSRFSHTPRISTDSAHSQHSH